MSVTLETMSADLSSLHQAKSCLIQDAPRQELAKKLGEEAEEFDREELETLALKATELLDKAESKLTNLRKQNIKNPGGSV